MNENQKISLLPYEWSVVVLFCLILISLSLYSLKTSAGSDCPREFSQQLVKVTEMEVQVRGAVGKPGVYRLPLRAVVRDLLERAELLPTADLSHVNMRKKVDNGEVVDIPYRRPITIYLSGAVEQPGEMEILSGTRYSELAEQIEVSKGANLSGLKRKKSFVQEGALIAIPLAKKKGRVAH